MGAPSLAILAAIQAAAVALASGEPPKTPIVLGMSTVLTGPAAELGQGMKAGVEAALAEINRAGGIDQRTLTLVALDDGYEPDRAAPNVHSLIEDYGVIAIVGNVGTPTAVAAIPVALKHQTAFFGAFSGAGLLRKSPPDREVINFRAGYAEETAAMVDALISHASIEPGEIAFFTQRDAYGDAGFAGGIAALKRHGLTRESAVAHGRYERNTVTVENALADILSASTDPKAIIMVGTYAPCAAFIKLARTIGIDPIFLNVSFVSAPALASAAGDAADGVIVTQVVPPPSSELPIVREYRAALASLDPDVAPSHVSLEGYIAARILIKALATTPPTPARESVVDALLALGDFDIGLGQPLRLAPDRHQACSTVWPTIIRGGRVEPFDWADLAARSKDAPR